MKQIAGVGACSGIAIGKLLIHDNTLSIVEPRQIEHVEAELLRFDKARQRAIENIEELRKEALKKVGPEESMIFCIHQMLLKDQAYITQVESIITIERVCAEYAVQQAGKQFAMMFRDMDNSYMKERSADVVDVSSRIVRILSGEPLCDLCEGNERFVLAVPDLLPSEAIQMDCSKVLAIITSKGSRTSHAVILSRAMGIPTVVETGIQLSQLRDGQIIIVDGTNGVLIQDPDEAVLWEYERKTDAYKGLSLWSNRFKNHLTEILPMAAKASDMEAVIEKV